MTDEEISLANVQFHLEALKDDAARKRCELEGLEATIQALQLMLAERKALAAYRSQFSETPGHAHQHGQITRLFKER